MLASWTPNTTIVTGGFCYLSITLIIGKSSENVYNSVKHFEQARKPRSYASPKLCPLNHLGKGSKKKFEKITNKC